MCRLFGLPAGGVADAEFWRLLGPGELLHIGPDLVIERSVPFPAPPRQLLRLAGLDPAAASQHDQPVGGEPVWPVTC